MFNKKLLSHFDWALLTFCLALVGIGVLAVYSATYEEDRPLSLWTIRQTLWVGLGLIGMFVAFAVDYRHLKRWVPLLYSSGYYTFATDAGHRFAGRRCQEVDQVWFYISTALRVYEGDVSGNAS